jgi:hypothetical protein
MLVRNSNHLFFYTIVASIIKFLILVLVLTLCLALGYMTVQHYVVETILDKVPTAENVQALSKAVPNNSYVEAALGRMYGFSAETFDPPLAVHSLLASLQVQPYDASGWMSLGNVYEIMYEIPKARQTFKNASTAAPTSTRVAWVWANFLIRDESGSGAETLHALKRIAELEPGSLENVLRLGARTSIPMAEIYRQVVAPDAASQLAAMNFFTEAKQYDVAALAWKALISIARSRKPLETLEVTYSGELTRKNLLTYVNFLINEGRIEPAESAWREFLEVIHYSVASSDPANLVFNPRFEQEPLNSGFDWRMEPSKDFEFFRVPVPPGAPLGGQCAVINFPGKSNIDFTNVYQYVPVKPNQQYRFSAWAQSKSLTTDSGVFVEIVDATSPTHSVKTAALLGDVNWTELRADISTGRESKLLLIRLRRNPSDKFDNLLGGQVWFGDFKLRAVNSGDKE